MLLCNSTYSVCSIIKLPPYLYIFPIPCTRYWLNVIQHFSFLTASATICGCLSYHHAACLSTDENSPTYDQLDYIGRLDEESSSGSLDVIIGAGRPPVPARLTRKIVSGGFVEMSDLLLYHPGTTRKDDKCSKHTRWSLTILE